MSAADATTADAVSRLLPISIRRRRSRCSRHPGRARHRRVLPHDLPAEVPEDVVDVGAAPRRGFVVRRVAPALRDGEGAGTRDGAVFLEVGLVADEDDGRVRVVLDPDDLFSELRQFEEAVEARDGEDEEESVTWTEHARVGSWSMLHRPSGQADVARAIPTCGEIEFPDQMSAPLLFHDGKSRLGADLPHGRYKRHYS